MPKIKNEDLEGRIKELHSEHNLEFYTTSVFATAKKWIGQIGENVDNAIAVDIETDSLFFYKGKILGIGLAVDLKKAIYIDFSKMSVNRIKETMELIANLPQKKIMHNSFFDRKFILGTTGIDIYCDYDTYTYAHTLYNDRQYYDDGLSLKELTREFLPYGDYENELVTFKKDYCKVNKIKQAQFNYGFIPSDILSPYCCMDVISTIHLFNVLEKTVIKKEKTDWTKIRNVIDILHKANDLYIKASVRGLQVNKDKVLEIHNELKVKLVEVEGLIQKNSNVKKAEKIIQRLALVKMQEKRKSIAPLTRCRKIWKENTFNIASNQHKTILLFEVLKLKPIGKTKSGSPSVDVKTITHFAEQGIEVMSQIDTYNKINKILTSFLNVDKGDENGKGLWGLVSDKSRIHPNFNLNGTISNRLSTTSSNIAQYPSKGLAKVVKKCIEVEEGYKLISFDFKSFEVAILAFIANEPTIKNMLENEYDPHAYTAYNVFKEEMELESTEIHDIMNEIKEKYNKTFRFCSKSINFLIPYDGGANSLAKSIGGTRKEAQNILDTYFKANSKVAEFMKNNKLEANKQGYIENYYGSRLYLRNVKKYNPFKNTFNKNWKAISEYRVTTNFKIQSFNSFYLYTKIVPFFKEIEEKGLDISLMFTIYDSVMVRVKEDIDDEVVVDLFKKHFETIMDGVPFGIDVSRTPEGKRDWYSYEDIELYTTNNKELLKNKGGNK